ncbi:MAG: glycosyltransferase family 4 protein [Rhodocyclaceae bacterium]|nr:glycosyltransferase family 4 protein [Rhodocyclaceae bacterium]
MKILQMLHNHKTGGAEHHLVALCEGLRERGHEVEFAGAASSWIGQTLAGSGFPVHDFDFRGHYDVAAMLRLPRLLTRNGYDLVHTHLVRAARYAQLAVRFTGTPLVCSVHDLLTWRHYPRRHALIAVSDAVRRHLVSRGFSPERVQVIHPGARDCGLGPHTAALRDVARASLAIADDTVAIGLVGRVAEVKAHDIAIAAVARLAEQVSRPFRLFVIGPLTGWGRAQQAACTRAEVEWLGARKDIPQLLAAMDICIQPSRSEGMPLAVMEAASAGKPVIASRVGGVPEIIEDGVSGLLVEPGSSRELADALARLIETPGMGRGLGDTLQQRFGREFSLPVMIERTERHYATVLGGAR